MSDECNMITVFLEKDMHEESDDLAAIMSAIRQLRGVMAVDANSVDPMQYIAEERARSEFRKKIIELVYEK